MSEKPFERQVLIHLLGVAVVGTVSSFCAVAVTAAESTELAPLPDLHLRLDAEGVVVVAPGGEEYQAVARTLAEGIQEHASQAPRIVNDSTAPAELGPGPILVLGNLLDSRVARQLYLHGYDFTDYSWPSPDGHVVRTIRDPFGTGAHVILLGGSDVAGVAEAAKTLLAIVAKHGPTLGYANRVRLGRWADEIRSYSEELLADDDAVWLRSGVSGSWDYQIQIARAGIGYLRTGDEAYLPVFDRELRYWFDHDVYHPKGDAPQMLHGFLNTILIVWDLIRDHPYFDEEKRNRFDRDFLYVFRSREGPGRIDGASKRTIIRDNHGTRTALDAVFGGRYFLRRFGLPDGRRWLEIADRYFAVQMASSKPVEDSWGHQWAASLYNTVVYAMATGQHEHFRSDLFKLAADRALIAHDAGEGPVGYLAACAVAADDAGYLSGWQGGEEQGKHCAAMRGNGDEYLRSFCTGLLPKNREDLLGIAIAPDDRLWYDTIDGAGFNPGGLFVVTPEREECFDKISIREGWQRDDYYLLFDGISGGHHSYQDGNCIVRFCEGGPSWIAPQHSTSASATVRSQNGVFVAFDGAGPGQLHRYARRLYAAEKSGYMAAAGALEGVGEVDWQRHILRKSGKWTLIIDRAIVRRRGEVLAERHWHLAGDVVAGNDGLVCTQNWQGRPRVLHLQSAGVKPEGMAGTNHRVETVRAEATPDHPLELATLLYVNADPTTIEFTLTKTEAGWRVDGRNGAEFISADSARDDGMVVLSSDMTVVIGGDATPPAPSYAEALTVRPVLQRETLPLRPATTATALPWKSFAVSEEPVTAVALAEGGRLAAGDAAGKVVLFASEGGKLAEMKLDSRILSLHFVGDDLLAGEDRSCLTRLSPDGTERWRVEMPYRPMAWPYWSEQQSRVREITSADINDDGKEEILISNADRRVYAFTGEGKQLWEASVQWGVYTAMTVGRHQGKFALFGGASQPAMHGWCIVYGGEGRLKTHFLRPDLISWSIPCQFRDMRLADVDGDGRAEVINAVDTNCRQLVVYQRDGKVRWDADVAGAALAVAVRHADDAATVYCSSASGYISAFDGKTGRRHWACFVGEPAKLIAPSGRGTVVAVAPSGKVYLLSNVGELIGCHDLHSEATGLLRPGDHRGSSAILLGTHDGRLLFLAETQSSTQQINRR